MSSIPCDVVILPSPLLADIAISASQRLAQFDNLFVLEDGKYYPHASLYMLQLKTEDLDKARTLLSNIARATTPLQLTANRYDHTEGFIDAEYQTTSELAGLQNDVIKVLNSIRDGMREKDRARMQEANGLALENYQHYGYKHVGELFRPHMTLSRLSSNNDTALQVLGDIRAFDGIFLKLGLFEMGDNGTCIRKLGKWQLLK